MIFGLIIGLVVGLPMGMTFALVARRLEMYPFNEPMRETYQLKVQLPEKEPGYREPAKITVDGNGDWAGNHEVPVQGPKVIRRGPKTFEGDCDNCGAEFEYELRHCHKKFDGGMLHIACPECKSTQIHIA